MKPIISPNTRIRYPQYFTIGDYSIVDDYSYFSTKVKIGRYCHVAAGCTILGGKDFAFTLGNYSSVSTGVRILCRSNDFSNDLVVLNPENKEIQDKHIAGNITIGDMCGIGANSVIMPGNEIPEGTVIGALSFVPTGFRFKEWCVYGGSPIKFIKKRNKKNVLKQVALLEK